MVKTVNDAEFQQELKAHDKVVVKYYADWCGSCRLIAPKYDAIAEKDDFKGITFLNINAEENPEARKLAGVTNLPFFAAFKDGQLVEGFAAARAEAIEELAKNLG